MAFKSVLITGCSAGGIGFALVEAFQRRNFHVFATARDQSKMEPLGKLPNVTLLSLNPTSLTSVQAAVRSVHAQTGGTLDYLVNNAGQTIVMPTLDFDIGTAREMYEINVLAMVRVTQEFAPLLIAAKGTIVSISSIASSVITPWMGVSAGSKAAMTAITEALRLELAPFGITVVTVNTGAVRTNNFANGVNFELPSTSLYKSIEKQIAARARGEDGTPRMEPSVYAEKVVDDILGGASGQIWRGGYASLVRFVLSKLPVWVSDWMFIQNTGLDAMKTKPHSD